MRGMIPRSFIESAVSGPYGKIWRPGRQRVALLASLACLLLALWPGAAVHAQAAQSQVPSQPGYYAGWAVEAYPEQTSADMEAILRRMATHGANVV